ncbi:MAG: PAS domain-containing protein [Deltaproteobacteria bacterium]|nr:PAS domain-containing protein [Deltaproteobacteria bacterium]
MNRKKRKTWIGTPPWLLLGSVLILAPIFMFWTLQNIHKEKESTTRLLLEKGAALIRSFEAGARTGMMGMMGRRGGGGFQLQRLLAETAQQPDIDYLIVTDKDGTILAHSDPEKIGETYGRGLDPEQVYESKDVEWRQISNPDGVSTFEIFRRFMPAKGGFHGSRSMMMPHRSGMPENRADRGETKSEQIIYVGLDMGPIESARRADTRHTVIMAAILLLIGFAGIFSLFMVQAYRSTRMSLSRIKAFSDNVVENMPIGLLAIDGEGKVASFNQTAESVLERPSEVVLGKSADEVLPNELWALRNRVTDEKRVLEQELDCPLGEGRAIPLGVSLSKLEGDDGMVLGDLILFRDLTEVRALQKEIERSERLASLGRLAAGIAHEIRNPLSSIKGFATYFGERYKNVPEDRKTAEIMVQEVERLNRVITQLLEFARPMTVQKKPSPLGPVIQHSLKTIEREALTNDVKIETKLPDEIPQIPMDGDRIHQVLLNLYLNAIEAMEEGGTLAVEVANEAGGLRITVSDTGKGIKGKDISHVFDPYFTTKQSGTGLGLAIVHKIIESHEGDIKLDSEPGKGTRVTIILPVFDG